MLRTILLGALISSFANAAVFSQELNPDAPSAPTDTMDYLRLAFYPQRWKEQNVSTQMYAWPGKTVVLLTPSNDYDADVMTTFIGHLDRGYQFYEEVVGAKPLMHRVWLNRPVIAAVPSSRLTCGFGCGMVGAAGIEVTNFPRDYEAVKANPRSMPHYYFYEMGRNYYVFGDRHNAFVTGFAVFMRYCCLESLEIQDNDKRTRTAIDGAIDAYEDSDLGFVKAFTSAGGLSEKQNRIANYRGPCDQPVMYASAMLKLRGDYGGDEFIKRFYQTVRLLPRMGQGSKDPEAAYRQCIAWMIAASYAAKQDLSDIFADQWRLTVDTKLRLRMKKANWKSVRFDPVEFTKAVLVNLPIFETVGE